MILIAEIGNNHEGCIKKAKKMILKARDSGATHVKMQAIRAETMQGSMQPSFYRKCQFSIEQYLQLIDYGKEHSIPVFYSIFDQSYQIISETQNWHKLAAGQTKQLSWGQFRRYDHQHVFISQPMDCNAPKLYNAGVMHVSDYMTKTPRLERISFLRKYHSSPYIGYSDHTVGPEACIKAVKQYGANIIEKHFTIDRVEYYGHIFRDSVHGATPAQFKKIAKGMGLL